MSTHTELIRLRLNSGPATARQLAESIRISQPTISRSLSKLGDEIIRIGSGPSIQYALKDATRGMREVPIYRVDMEGKIRALGMLIPVMPDGFVMLQDNGEALHSHGLPWWLSDMRPQGYLGRAYVARHAANLGLPSNLNEWHDSDAMRALIAHGHDAVGNLLIGDVARGHFLQMPNPVPITPSGQLFARLAKEAASGESPGSSAGGEQPKFTAFVQTDLGAQHVLVKFTADEKNPVTERWKDLLLAEHLASETLREAGISATKTQIVDHDLQRFLMIHRFDRVTLLGRRGLFSLSTLDAEFVGLGTGGWHIATKRLLQAQVITAEAFHSASLLYAFGRLIGNTDMHFGNISFMSEHGRPYHLAPAYDMLPMTFSPKAGGGIANTIIAPLVDAGIDSNTWNKALALARSYLTRLENEDGFNHSFTTCLIALRASIEETATQISRLA